MQLQSLRYSMDTSIFSYAKAAQAQEVFSEQQLDNLLDIVYDTRLSEAEKDAVLEALLPSREHHAARYGGQSNEELFATDFVNTYAGYRALGLPLKDAARLCGISVGRLNSLLQGVGLSRKYHRMILEAEASALSKFKRTNLKVLHNAAQEGKWAAAVALLEKVLPDEYGKRMEVHNSGTMKLSVEECEAMSKKADDDLQALRAARQQQELERKENADA